jgi:hypothetical protein
MILGKKQLRRLPVILLILGAGVTIMAGLGSYAQGLPGDSLCIPEASTHRDIHVAMIRGVLYLVYSAPTSVTPRSTFDLRLGPFSARQVTFGKTSALGAGVPFWAVAIALGAYPARAWIRERLRQRWIRRCQERNVCVVCEYSLEGLTERRCPECGKGF